MWHRIGVLGFVLLLIAASCSAPRQTETAIEEEPVVVEEAGPVPIVYVVRNADGTEDVLTTTAPSPEAAEKMIYELQSRDDVIAAEVNDIVEVTLDGEHPAPWFEPPEEPSKPNDPKFPDQWALPKLQICCDEDKSAWTLSTGAGVTVAVIDLGVDRGIEDFKTPDPDTIPDPDDPENSNPILRNGYNVQLDNEDTHTDPGVEKGEHGTNMSSVIAAIPNNKTQKAGATIGAKILPIKKPKIATDFQNAKVIEEAVERGAKVVNMSYGDARNSAVAAAIVEYAHEKGVTLVASSGNKSKAEGKLGEPRFPAAYPGVIGVGAIDSDEKVWQHSDPGYWVDVAAPGVGILNATGDKEEGTSEAAAFVSGVSAILLAYDETLTAAEVAARLANTTKWVNGQQGWRKDSGSGLVQAHAAPSSLRQPALHQLDWRSPG